MSLLFNTTTKDLSEVEDSVENEQFVQISKYTRTNKKGDGIEVIAYRATSKGKNDAQLWIKRFLSEEKENLYLQALRNLYRKIDFIELSQALESEDISEEEFDKELEENEDRYLIPSPTVVPTVKQVIQVSEIMKKLGREKSSVDEVSEVFSLDMDKAMEVLQTY